jgi:glycerate kinase
LCRSGTNARLSLAPAARSCSRSGKRPVWEESNKGKFEQREEGNNVNVSADGPPPLAPAVVLAPDAFKGSLAAPAICAAMARGLLRVWPRAEIRRCPMADGGEGTLDAVLTAVGARGHRHVCTVSGAAGEPRAVAYGILDGPDGPTALIEVAQVVGFADEAALALPVAARSTWGVGELIRALLDRGLRRFLVALGGSSTNEGGAGMLAALGVRLLDSDGVAIAAAPSILGRLERVDVTALDPRLEKCELTLLADVDNPLCGPGGATAVFGPQKGVAVADLAVLDAALARFALHVESALGRRVAASRGAGAAGGLSFALQVLGGTFRSGAEFIADLVGLDAALRGADWLITGEGRSDSQTLGGKAPLVAARRARTAGVPATLVSGALDSSALPELGRHFAGCFAIPAAPSTLAESIAGADELLADRVEQLARLWAAARS